MTFAGLPPFVFAGLVALFHLPLHWQVRGNVQIHLPSDVPPWSASAMA